MHMICIYRPPNLPLASFPIDIEVLLAQETIKGHDIVVAGDINIHLDSTTNGATSKILDTLNLFNTHIYVHSPTHKSGYIIDTVACMSPSAWVI